MRTILNVQDAGTWYVYNIFVVGEKLGEKFLDNISLELEKFEDCMLAKVSN